MYTKFTYVYIKFVFVRIQNLHAYVLYNRQTEKYTEEKKEKENRKRYERKNRKKKKKTVRPHAPSAVSSPRVTYVQSHAGGGARLVAY